MPESLEPADRFDAITTTAMESQHLASVSIGVRREGEPDILRSYGVADLENDVPATPRAVYRIGSLTKMFTAAVVMRLVERGALHLNDTLGEVVPDFPTHGHRITVEQLLTHTSGIKNYTELPAFVEQARRDLTHQQMARLVATEPLDFEPGADYKYSNSGYYLLGVIIEIASGSTYYEVVERELCVPLQLRDTCYVDDYRLIKHRVRGYDIWNEMTFNSGQLSMMPPFAAGGLGSSAADLIEWGSALLGHRVVTADSLKRMTTPGRLNDGTPTAYGFGMELAEVAAHRKWFHSGRINGFRSLLALYPDVPAIVAVLCNTGAAEVERLESQLARAALALPDAVPDAPR
ncbi:MAG: serine hydrolase domain-containing protein [Acidobacteriota bacterium]